MSSLISAKDTVALYAVLLVVVWAVNWVDQHFKIANKLGTIIMYVIIGFILANVHFIPFEAQTYKDITGILVPLAVPMLLFKSDLKKIYRESGRVFLAFNLAAISSVIAAFLSAPIAKSWVGKDLAGFLAMNAAAYIGGTINMVAMSQVYKVDPNLLSAEAMLGNFMLGVLLFLLSIICGSRLYRRLLGHPYIDAREALIKNDPEATKKPFSAVFWKNRELSMLDILKSFATAFVILALSKWIASWVMSLKPPFVIGQLFGSYWLVMTTLSVAGATLLPKWFSSLKFGDEFGMIMMSLWFVTVGASGNMSKLGQYGAIVIICSLITMAVHFVLSFLLGKIFHLPLEDMACSIAANIGGPSTGASMAISQGWADLIAPTILCALYGYIIGNYVGVFVGNFFL